MKEIKTLGVCLRKCAQKYGIPHTTLQDYKNNNSMIGTKRGRKQSIPKQIEDEIIKKVLQAADAGFP